MPQPIFTEIAASISELKINPIQVVASGDGMPIVILHKNAPVFYCIPVATYEAMLEMIDDIELLKIVKERQHEESIRVALDDL